MARTLKRRPSSGRNQAIHAMRRALPAKVSRQPLIGNSHIPSTRPAHIDKIKESNSCRAYVQVLNAKVFEEEMNKRRRRGQQTHIPNANKMRKRHATAMAHRPCALSAHPLSTKSRRLRSVDIPHSTRKIQNSVLFCTQVNENRCS